MPGRELLTPSRTRLRVGRNSTTSVSYWHANLTIGLITATNKLFRQLLLRLEASEAVDRFHHAGSGPTQRHASISPSLGIWAAAREEPGRLFPRFYLEKSRNRGQSGWNSMIFRGSTARICARVVGAMLVTVFFTAAPITSAPAQAQREPAFPQMQKQPASPQMQREPVSPRVQQRGAGHAQGQVSVSTEARIALEPHGRWQQHSRWGQVWIPANRGRDWRPYTVGRWVYTDDWGWYWVEDEEEASWGSVTYHYGRWISEPDIGWAWIPGEEWGPGFVQWRHGAERVGWAPLPPDEIVVEFRERPAVWIFVGVRDFVAAPRLARVILPSRDYPIFLRETIVVNQTVLLRDRGRFAVNPGIPPTVIAAAIGRPLRAFEVRPRVLAGTAQIPGAIEVRAQDIRSGSVRGQVTVRQTQNAIQPTGSVPQLKPLGAGEQGRLGDNPPRAARRDAPAPTTGQAPATREQQQQPTQPQQTQQPQQQEGQQQPSPQQQRQQEGKGKQEPAQTQGRGAQPEQQRQQQQRQQEGKGKQEPAQTQGRGAQPEQQRPQQQRQQEGKGKQEPAQTQGRAAQPEQQRPQQQRQQEGKGKQEPAQTQGRGAQPEQQRPQPQRQQEGKGKQEPAQTQGRGAQPEQQRQQQQRQQEGKGKQEPAQTQGRGAQPEQQREPSREGSQPQQRQGTEGRGGAPSKAAPQPRSQPGGTEGRGGGGGGPARAAPQERGQGGSTEGRGGPGAR